MHRSRAPSIAPGTFFVAQSWADFITDMPGFDLRQAQGRRVHGRRGLRPGESNRTPRPDLPQGVDPEKTLASA